METTRRERSMPFLLPVRRQMPRNHSRKKKVTITRFSKFLFFIKKQIVRIKKGRGEIIRRVRLWLFP
jgi:hypothetical protein